MGFLAVLTKLPPFNIPCKDPTTSVPILTNKALLNFERSDISSGAVAIIGLAPTARVILADWFETTIFVI
jgi:hypothetical protein